MTDLLTPPREFDLPTARAEAIRVAVLRSADDPPPRRSGRVRWLLVPVAVAALALVVALIGPTVGRHPSVLGSPSPAPSGSTASPADPDRVDTDAGPLDEAEAVADVERWRQDRGLTGPELARVVLARRTTTALGDGVIVVWTDVDGSTWWHAETPDVSGVAGPVSGSAVRHVRLPDADHPVVRLTDLTFVFSTDADRPDATARDVVSSDFYLVSEAVDRVEVRITIAGLPGPWFSAPVHDGYAFVPAVAPGPHSTTENIDKITTIEDRAFDRDGTRVPVVERR